MWWISFISASGGSPALPAPICSGLCVQGRWWLRPGQGHQAWRLMASSSAQLVLAHVTSGSGKITRAELLSVKRVVGKYLRFFKLFQNQRINNITHIYTSTKHASFPLSFILQLAAA